MHRNLLHPYKSTSYNYRNIPHIAPQHQVSCTGLEKHREIDVLWESFLGRANSEDAEKHFFLLPVRRWDNGFGRRHRFRHQSILQRDEIPYRGAPLLHSPDFNLLKGLGICFNVACLRKNNSSQTIFASHLQIQVISGQHVCLRFCTHIYVFPYSFNMAGFMIIHI